ncbi:uncharacterized protein LOC123681305 [Harmonia axyridis]|uniref:uncharacterized protein LOC123681305 n=1 Tax=Harmonia axyridis TaxID=115357 RepID=UPI001E278B72|nr:uncharacterized protein LOC123681305 [Harmonia axyridis]
MADYCTFTARSRGEAKEGTSPYNPRNMNAPTIVIHPPSISMDEDNNPDCCEPQDPPIHRRLKDRTITTAPYRGQDDLRGISPSTPRTRTSPQNLGGTFVASRRNMQDTTFSPNFQSSAIPSPPNVTRDVTPPHMRDLRYDTCVTPPVGFEQFSQFGTTYDQPPLNSTYTKTSSFPTETTSGSDFLTSGEYSDQGPWKNFAIPKKLKKVNIAPSAHKTYPRSAVPPPSRNYSTYNDKQPILDVKEVAAHRKKAPRFYSTPTTTGMINDGTGISSVWGQDMNSVSGSYVDSSIGWTQGVRMDSFNAYRQMTPSPKNVQVPPRYNATQILGTKKPTRIPAAHATHTYLQNPYPNVPNIMLNPSAESSRINATRTINKAGPANMTVTIPPQEGKGFCAPCSEPENMTVTIPPEEEEGYCAPCATGESSCLEDEEAAKRKDAGKDVGKDFCTVLEIRTPCANNTSKPDNPLNLSIHVTCTDPTYLVTPDKRFNVIGHNSAPKVKPCVEPQKQIDDVPSDCRCE